MAGFDGAPAHHHRCDPFQVGLANVEEAGPFWTQHPLVTVGSRVIDGNFGSVEREYPEALDGIDK